MRRSALFVLGSTAVAIGIACGTLESSDGTGTDGGSPPDGDVADHTNDDSGPGLDGGDAGPACDTTSPWSTPPKVVIQRNDLASGTATLSEDELTIYFDINVSLSIQRTIVSAQRGDRMADFGNAAEISGVPVPPIYTWEPALSPNGLAMYYASNQYVSGTVAGTSHIWFATRPNPASSFTDPKPSGGVAGYDDFEPWATADELWFSSSRDGGEYDLYRAPLDGGMMGTPVPIPELESDQRDGKPVLTRDGLTVFFSSWREQGAQHNYEIWTASRPTKSSPFAMPTKVTELDTATADEAPVWISPDACRLYFTSSAGKGGIYMSERAR